MYGCSVPGMGGVPRDEGGSSFVGVVSPFRGLFLVFHGFWVFVWRAIVRQRWNTMTRSEIHITCFGSEVEHSVL